MEKKNKNKSYGKWTAIILYIMAGGFLGFRVAVRAIDAGKSGQGIALMILNIIWILIEFYLAMIIQVIVHEGGHLIAGLMSGYKFASFRILNLMVLKKNGKFYFKKFSLTGTGGQCLMAPPDMVDGHIPYVLYNLGGAMANVIFSAIIYGIYMAIGGVSDFCIITVIIGLILAILNGIPMHMGEVDNDGYNALSLGKNKAAERDFWIQMKINELTTLGVRLKDMPSEYFDIPVKDDMDNSISATIGVFACCRAMDELDLEKARYIAEKLMKEGSGLIGIHRNMLISEVIFCELLGANDKDLIDRLYEGKFLKYTMAMASNPSILRMRYAYKLFYKENEKEAAEVLKDFEKAAAKYPHESEILGERELIALTKAKYAELKNSKV